MQHQRDAHCLEPLPGQVGAGLGRRRRQLLAEHVRKVDPGLLENATALEHAAFSAAASRPVPGVTKKCLFTVQQFQLCDDPVLQ